MSKKDVAFNQHRAHFGPISQGMIDYVTNDVLLKSRYLFTKTVQGIKTAYCTHCKKMHYPDRILKHRSVEQCPKCQSSCTVYQSHLGRKYLIDEAYVVYYEKSAIDPQVIVAKGFYVRRDYTGDYQNVSTLYRPSSSYVFKMGGSEMYQAGYWEEDKWYSKENVVSEYASYHTIRRCYSRDSIRAAVEGTPFQYSTWESYDEQDMTKFFGLFTQYPCIEYLTKMGYSYFVLAKLYGLRTYDAIRWSGKSVEHVVRLKLKDFRQFKEVCPQISRGDGDLALAFRLYQLTLHDSDRPSLDDLLKTARKVEGVWNEIRPMFKYQSVMKCIQYVERQYRNGKKRYQGHLGVLNTWRDYIKQCRDLDYNLSQQEVVFPINLSAAHDRTTSQVEIMMSEIERRKIEKRVMELEKYHFYFDGYLIRGAKSGEEIINEGKKLRHCVGGYAKDHADGKTSILVIRKASDPDEPFFTMEVKAGKIIQVYGYRHVLPKADVKALVDAFRKAKIEKKEKPDKRQEVVV